MPLCMMAGEGVKRTGAFSMDERTVFWVGVAFSAALILVFVYAIFRPVQAHAQPLLRLLGAVCAGASAFLMSGAALIEITGSLGSGLNLLLRGTGGIALFILVWWQWGRMFDEGVGIRVPDGARFRDVVDVIVSKDDATVEFVNFSDAQLNAVLRGQSLRAKTSEEAMHALRLLSREEVVPSYTIQKVGSVYKFTA